MQERLKNLRRRHLRVRKRVIGTVERPRLSVNRSLKHVRAQLIDDITGRSMLGVSSLSPELQEQLAHIPGKCEKSRLVGRFLAQKALGRGIVRVIFDRGGYLYHGRVKALADGAREGGLQF